MARTFSGSSALVDDGIGLALAPALAPEGLVDRPSFFHGFAAHPQVLARGLATLADITATRYFQYVPTPLRDPVLTANGDRLRAECFSACNGVYARLDLLGHGFDGGDIGYGTTNVDIGPAMRTALSAVSRDALLHLDVGLDGMDVSTPDRTESERRVEMPDRWVRALGNAAELHRPLVPLMSLDQDQARAFVVALPPATGKNAPAWLGATRTGPRLSPRQVPGAVHVPGPHRLSALKRMLTHVRGMTLYGPADRSAGSLLVEVDLPDARLVLALTPEAWRGFSGEGSLLPALAGETVVEDADLVSALLAFEPVIDVDALSRDAALDEGRVRAALAVLASSGRVGWDAHDQAYFHRELPDDPDRVMKDNPRLVAAQQLASSGAVARDVDPEAWRVRSGGVDYLVRFPDVATASCTCAWYLRHRHGRGVCKHVLAVELMTGGSR